MAGEIASDDREKWLYLIQIQHLDEQLERCQLQCDELKKQNKDLVLQYSILEEEKTDITEYLQHCVAEEEKKVEELTERLESQRQAVEQEREALKLQLSRQLQELQDRMDELCAESSRQAAAMFEEQRELEELEEQLEHLMQQQLDKEALQRQLISEREEHEAAVQSLQREAKLERLKLLKEKQSKQEDYIKTRVSNIIQEERPQHRVLQKSFQVLLNKNMHLWKDNDELRKQEKDLCANMAKLKNVDKVIQETLTYKKEAKKLIKKCQQLEVEIKNCSSTHQSRLEENETLRQRLASASEECRQKTAEVDELRAEIQRKSSRREQLEGVLQKAAVTLGRMLMSSEKTSEAQWKILQEMLHSAEPQGPDSTPEESSQGQKPQTSDPEPASAETLTLATDPLFLMARYRLGDFGYIPRPMMKHKPASSRTGARLRLSRKLCSQRTSSCDPEASTSASTSADCSNPVNRKKDRC